MEANQDVPRIEETARLFIRNLPYGATEADLAEAFREHGEVSEVHLVLDRSFTAIPLTVHDILRRMWVLHWWYLQVVTGPLTLRETLGWMQALQWWYLQNVEMCCTGAEA